MAKLLRYELRRLLHARSLYVCLAVLGALALLPVGMLYALTSPALLGSLTQQGVTITAEQGVGLTGRYFLLQALSGGTVELVLAVFLGIFVCGAYTEGTVRNAAARGYGRAALYASGLVASSLAAALMVVLCWLCSAGAASALWGFGGALSGAEVAGLALQLLVLLAFAALLYLLCILTRATGAAIAIGVLAPSLIGSLLQLVDALTARGPQLADYWLPNVLAYCLQAGAASAPRVLACSALYLLPCSLAGWAKLRRCAL